MMPSFRKKVAGFIRQLSNPGTCITESEEFIKSPTSTGSFIQQYLNGDVTRPHPEILCGRSFQELPVRKVAPLSSNVCATYTGPLGGLTSVKQRVRHVDVMDPDLDFIDEDACGRTAKLAQQEDLEEFLEEKNHNNGHLKSRHRARKRKDEKNAENAKCSNNANYNCKGSNHSPSNDVKDPTEEVRWPSYDPATAPWRDCDVTPDTADKDGDLPEEDEDLIEDDEHLRGTEHREIAGVVNWNRPHRRAYGAATTLYERHPVTQRNAGDPIADAFAICARENNAILVLADGVNWGEKSCLAARCAIHGCVDYLNKTLFESHEKIETTKDIYLVLLRSLFAAHNLILQEDGMLTTLCVALVCPLVENPSNSIVCACNVGDSLAYVYSKEYGVREITQGSHDIYSMRDMRDALGALGPVDGPNPELSNLTCSMTVVDEGDIVFLTSDGISDNFDPVVGKFALIREDNNNRNREKGTCPMSSSSGCNNGRTKAAGQRNGCGSEESSSSGVPGSAPTLQQQMLQPPAFDPCLPVVEAHQRHALTLLRMEDLLNNGVSEGDMPCEDARQLCTALIDFAYKLTVAKRRILEDPELYATGEEHHSAVEQKLKRRRLGEKLSMVPGKLDHATVVAYQVGPWPGTAAARRCRISVPRKTEERQECNEQILGSSSPCNDKENQSPNLQPKHVSSLSMVCHTKHEAPPQMEAPPLESLV